MNFRQIGKAGLVVGSMVAALSVPAVAWATVYTPSPADLNDLDHHYLYTWTITDSSLIGRQASGPVQLVFHQIYNWDGTANDIFLYLIDLNHQNPNAHVVGSSAHSIVDSFQDDPLNSSHVSIDDDFADPRYHADPAWVVPAGDAEHYLTDRSFAGLGQSPNSAPGEADPAGWTHVADGNDGNGHTLYTYTYTFSQSDINALNAYITDGVFAIGLDPDCHYFNSEIDLVLNTSAQTPRVPEPASMFLVGTGLLALLRQYRKRS